MAFGIDDAIASATKLIDDAINRIWPDPAAKASGEALIIRANAEAALAQLRQQMSVMQDEARSTDPWTSRARPSFMYVMYILILAAIPMGIVSAVSPDTAHAIASGVQRWLAAIPADLWQMFGLCFVGYSASRTVEKVKGAAR
jgi:hypothetical protein